MTQAIEVKIYYPGTCIQLIFSEYESFPKGRVIFLEGRIIYNTSYWCHF